MPGVNSCGPPLLHGQQGTSCALSIYCCSTSWYRPQALAPAPTSRNLLSLIYPPPAAYLHNYSTTRHPRILDTTREVVALHRQRHVFPVQLCVTPIRMGGEACMG